MDSVNQKFYDIFTALEAEYDELSGFIESVEVMSDNKLFKHYLSKRKKIEDIVLGFKKYKALTQNQADLIELAKLETGENLKHEISTQIESLETETEALFNEIKAGYLKNKNTTKQKVKVEINSKDSIEIVESVIKNFLEKKEAKIEIQKQTENSLILNAFGEDIYDGLMVLCGNLKIIQNAKAEEVKVVVLNEQIYETEINLEDIEIKTSKSSGAGGQHINKTESAVRLVHLPTGISVECQDDRSQTKNKERALELLKEKISQKLKENNEKYIKNQRNNIKNAIFSNSISIIFDYDKHIVTVNRLRKEYDLKQIEQGELDLILNDLSV